MTGTDGTDGRNGGAIPPRRRGERDRFRIFAAWRDGQDGPMFCRWIPPAAPRDAPDAEEHA